MTYCFGNASKVHCIGKGVGTFQESYRSNYADAPVKMMYVNNCYEERFAISCGHKKMVATQCSKGEM